MSKTRICPVIRAGMLGFLLVTVFSFSSILEANPNEDAVDVIEGEQGVPEIVGGQEVTPGAYPFMAMVAKRVDGDGLRCGGALIDPEWVLTAAHCVSTADIDGETDVVDVILGRHDRGTREGIRVTSQAIYIHPDFGKEWHPNNDIALIHLERPVTEYESVRVATDVRLNEPGQMITAIGWGRDDSDSITPRLHEVDMPVVSSADCRTKQTELLTNNMICTGYKIETGIRAGTCFGDSGSPIFTKENNEFVVLGLVSIGSDQCHTGQHYSIHTRVTVYTDWIQAHLEGNPWHPAIKDGLFYRTADQHEPNNDQSTATPLLLNLFESSQAEVSQLEISQEHTLSDSEDEDWFTFTLTRSTKMIMGLFVSSNENLSISMTLFDETLNLYESGDYYSIWKLGFLGDCEAETSALPAGTYFIRVKEDSGKSAVYNMLSPDYCEIDSGSSIRIDQYEPDSNVSMATPIEYGERQAHTLLSEFDYDWLTFTLTETGGVVVRLDGTVDENVYGIGYESHQFLTLYDQFLQPIGLDLSNSVQDKNDKRVVSEYRFCGSDALPVGSYLATVHAEHPNFTPLNYEITLKTCDDTAEPNDTAQDATPISYGEKQTHDLLFIGDTDWLSFTLPTTSSVGIEFVNVAATEDVRFTLFDADSQFMATQITTDAAYISYCNDNALPPGKYQLKIKADGNDSIPMYTVELRDCFDAAEPNDSAETANPLIYDEQVVGSIDSSEDEDWFVLTLDQPQEAVVEIVSEAQRYGGEITLSLYDENLDLITADTGHYEAFCGGQAMAAGTYYIRVAETRGVSIPSYTMRSSECGLPPDEDLSPDSYENDNEYRVANSIIAGEQQIHNISTVLDEDWMVFTVDETADVVITVEGEGDMTATLYQYSSIGTYPLTEIEYSDDFYGIMPHIRACDIEPGTYYIVTQEYLNNERVSEYTVQFEFAPCDAPDSSVPLSVQLHPLQRERTVVSPLFMITMLLALFTLIFFDMGINPHAMEEAS